MITTNQRKDMNNSINIENVGPIERLDIPTPEGGGIVVLGGRNGRGKSQAIAAVEASMGGSPKGLTVRDGELRGRVESMGVTITVGRQNRRSGDLVVDTLEGRLAVAQVVDPGLKDEAAADARRIKALVNLVGAKPDPQRFRALLGDQWDEIVKPSRETATDLVAQAEGIKRDCDEHARRIEGQADQAEANAHASLKLVGDNVDAPKSSASLQADLEAAIRVQSSVFALRTEADEVVKRLDAARDQLATVGDTAATVKVCQDRVQVKEAIEFGLRSREKSISEQIEQLQREANQVAKELVDASEIRRQAQDELARAYQADQAAEAARETLGQVCPTRPTDDQIAAAAAAIEAAREAIEAAAVQRAALAKKAEADAELQRSVALRRQADDLRAAGHRTDEILSEAVAQASQSLFVEGGRLVTKTVRGKTYFADLSMGERWRIVVDLAADAVGVGGMFTIPQEAWEALDPINRDAVAAHVKRRGVIVITAEATAAEGITAATYQPQSEGNDDAIGQT